jgi:hypothetical protein
MFKRFKYEAEDSGDVGAGGGSVEPVVTPSTVPSADDGSVNEDWGSLSEDDPVDVGDSAGTAAEPVAPAPTPAQVPAPTAPVPTPLPTAAEPPVQPSAEPSPTPAPTAPPVDIAALRKTYLGELEDYYKIDADTASQLQTEPELVLPKLAASVHIEVLDAVMSALPQRVMALIQQNADFTKREATAKDYFFEEYPELRNHEDTVMRVGRMFREANPKASKAEARKQIGEFVMMSLNLKSTKAASVTPSAPSNPFTPASGSGGVSAPPQPGEWDFIVEDD